MSEEKRLPFAGLSKFNRKSVSNRGTFCSFSFTPMSKCTKNIYKYKNFLLKSTFLDYRVQNVPEISSKTLAPWFAWSKTSEENKEEFLEGQFRNEKLSFVHKKKKLSTLLNFPFPFTSFPLQWGCAALAEAPLLSTLIIFLILLFHVLSSLSFVFLSCLNSDHSVWCSKYLHLSLFSLSSVGSFTN